MSNYSDQLSLYKVTTTMDLIVVAKSSTDAEGVVGNEYADIVGCMMDSGLTSEYGPKIIATEIIDELEPNSALRNYYPHGDEYGEQYPCEYYTISEKNKRMKEHNERQEKIKKIVSDLDEESIALLEDYLRFNSLRRKNY